MIRGASMWLCLALIGSGFQPVAAESFLERESSPGESEEVTVITAERLTFDYNNRYAVFEENVQVDDPGLRLTSDELRLSFDEEGEVSKIHAVGRVVIHQEDKIAYSGEAHYDVANGKIVLLSDPRVKQGNDYLEADTITFLRLENKMICEPHARLVIHPREDGNREKLFMR